MDLKFQKRLAARTLGVGLARVSLDPSRFEDIKEAITKSDIRNLVKQGAIILQPLVRTSRLRARERHAQRKKGRQAGQGSRHGRKLARSPRKRQWINKIRSIRVMIQTLKDKNQIDNKTYRDIYMKSKGGFFRDRGHIMFYLESNKLLKK
ncbi:MAG TPA: 50S ribosomal protein L19e [Nanoarchaeota archaeon]|nr:50S ribosomal protein L19e [Nanoarchaeota archaeon]